MKQLVIMPGGFHPFHAGHAALYQSALESFPGADVYVAATNDTSTRPFPFPVKEKLAQLAGVSKGRFVQVKSPFRAEEITASYDPNNTQLIFVRSEKDAGSQPRPGGNKKDGSPSYLQPYDDASDLPMSQHAYMAYLPTVEFGPGMTSATEIRGAWPNLNEKRKTALVMSLYPKTQTNPKLAATVVKLLDTAMGTELNEFVSAGNNGSDDSEDEKTYLLQLAEDLSEAMYGPNKSKQAIENIMAKIRAVGGDVKITWNPDRTYNVAMYHPVYFKQGYLIRLVGHGDQGVAETINSAILNKKFKHKQVIGDYTYTATAEDFEGAPLLWIKAYDGNKEIGHVLFEIIVRSPGGRRKPSADYLESGGTEVDPAYRDKGIASTMYAYAKMLGNDIQASYSQTSQGKAMWAAWEKAGDAKHLIGTSMESTVSEDLNEGPFVQRIMHPGKVNIYVRSGKVPKLVATDIPYEILDKYIAKVISKYPQFKASDFSFKSSDKVNENTAPNPRVDLTPNYPNYATLVGEFIGVKKNRVLFRIVSAELKPGQGETEKIFRAMSTNTPIGIEIGRVKNRAVLENTQKEFILYIDGKPAAKYVDQQHAVLDMAAVRKKYPAAKLELKHEVYSTQPVKQINEGGSILEVLKPDAFNALQQAKQRIEQNRQQEVDQWAQDFRANSSKLAGQQLKQRFAEPPPEPPTVPVVQPGESPDALKGRLAQLNIAKQKFEEINALIKAIKKKYQHSAIEAEINAIERRLDTGLLPDVKAGAADNYKSLLAKLDNLKTSLTTRFIVKEAPDYIEEGRKI